ncbi:MAG: hypothetical protein HYR88_13265 [Verrucomicrobia bacterium]|nr:hypothetical protein [Verrucomicrobiota bacterium]MBI3867264.1 hypothetical protein [Verrucomicrobiota bacterium]
MIQSDETTLPEQIQGTGGEVTFDNTGRGEAKTRLHRIVERSPGTLRLERITPSLLLGLSHDHWVS